LLFGARVTLSKRFMPTWKNGVEKTAHGISSLEGVRIERELQKTRLSHGQSIEFEQESDNPGPPMTRPSAQLDIHSRLMSGPNPIAMVVPSLLATEH
jgi:hypothetical protein